MGILLCTLESFIQLIQLGKNKTPPKKKQRGFHIFLTQSFFMLSYSEEFIIYSYLENIYL